MIQAFLYTLWLALAMTSGGPPPDPDATSAASPAVDPDADPPPALQGARFPSAGTAARNRRRMAAARHAPVHVLKAGAPVETGRLLCEKVVPWRPPETPVLLKPNLSGINRMKHGMDNGIELRTTGIGFLRGVIHCLRARGHTDITITEAWSRPNIEARWMELSGLKRLLEEEEGVRWVPMWGDTGADGSEEPMLRAPFPGARSLKTGLLIPRVLARHLHGGLFISIPRMKMHRFTVMSLGIKNNMGFVNLAGATPTSSKRSGMHKEMGAWLRHRRRTGTDDRALFVRSLESFAERIVDVLELELPDAVLIDGVPPVAGDGFALIEPLAGGVAIGSVNPVLAEAVAMEYMGYLDNAELEREIQHRTSPVLTEAARRFYDTTDVLHAVPIQGYAAFRAEPRPPAHFKGFPGFEVGAPPSPAPTLPWVARALVAPRISGEPPTLDGALTDAAWQAAPEIEIETDWQGRPAGPKTVARLTWTPEALYVAFDCAYEALHVDEAAPTDVEHPKLYAFDAVELFLDPKPRSGHTYREIELGPLGHFMDIDVNRRRRQRGDVTWSSGLDVATSIDREARRFIIEARIPAKALYVNELTRGEWRLGLYRISGKRPDRVYLARFPTRTRRPNFHVPSAFGWVRLTE